MPFRVKTRSGDEIVLRFSEWVYFLVALCVVSMLFSTVSLLLVFTRLSGTDGATLSEGAATAGTGRDSSAQPTPGESAGAAGARSAATAPAESAADGESDDGEPATEPVGDASERRALQPFAGAAGRRKLQTELEALLRERERSRDSQAADAGRDGEEPATAEAGAPGVEEPTTTSRAEAVATPTELSSRDTRFATLLPERAAFTRLLFCRELADELDRAAAGALAGKARLLAASLHDPDARVRALALRRLSAAASQLRSLTSEVAPWIRAADDWLGTGAEAAMLRELASSSSPAAEDPDGDLPWEAARAVARARLDALETLRWLDEDLERHAAVGLDAVFCIDVSESMQRPYETLRASAGQWLADLRWALPRARLGFLFYRDEVIETTGFDASTPQVLRSFEKVEAEGGGDVPEGIYEALKAALQLGRFEWRDGATRWIVLVSDVAPRYREVEPLLGLAAQAHREGGFRIETITVTSGGAGDASADGPVPYLPDLAREAGGAALEAGPDELVPTLFAAVFDPRVREMARRGRASLGRP